MAKRLEEIRKEELLPDELIGLVERVIPIQLAAQGAAQISLPEQAQCATAEAMFAGSPLVLREAFPYDEAQAVSLFTQFLELLGSIGGDATQAAATVRAAMDSGELDPKQALRALAQGDDALFAHWRAKLSGTPRALDFLVVSSLWPSLNAAAIALAPRLPENLPHDCGHCPLCGSLPYLTLLREKEGARFGVCSFCGHEHRVRRIACPYCDEAAQDKLKLFRVKEFPNARVDVCSTCNMYVKTLDFREMDIPPMPALDDMATLALDVLAQQQGYKRPTLSAWGF
jgi:FdhE protein